MRNMSEIQTASEPILAARYSGPKAIGIQQVPAAGLGSEEVKIAVSACGICGTDLHFFSGRWPQPGFTPGHEIAGTIIEIGPGVKDWKPGDRVCVEPIVACGTCSYCQRGEISLCRSFQFISVHRDGGFATRVVVPQDCLYKLPPELSDDLAALVEPLAVGVHAARVGGIGPGDRVVVCGSGTIGLSCVVAARALGASQVTSAARHPHQAETARQLGAIPVAPEDLEKAVLDATAGEGSDIVIETVGGPGQAVGQALGVVRSGGTVVLAGGFTRPTSVHLARVVNREIRLVGSNCYSRDHTPTDFEMAIRIATSGSYPLERIVTHRFPLGEIADAFAAALDKSTGAIKVQVNMPEGIVRL